MEQSAPQEPSDIKKAIARATKRANSFNGLANISAKKGPEASSTTEFYRDRQQDDLKIARHIENELNTKNPVATILSAPEASIPPHARQSIRRHTKNSLEWVVDHLPFRKPPPDFAKRIREEFKR